MATILSTQELAEALAQLPGWALDGDTHDGKDGGKNLAIEKAFVFSDFDQAFAFMTRVADGVRTMDHHPEWSNVYSRVHVRLTTHDAGGVTEKDVRLARLMEKVAAAG